MSKIFGSFLFKLVLTVAVSVFIGYQIAKIEVKEAQHSFRKILGTQVQMQTDNKLQSAIEGFLAGGEGDYAVWVKDLTPSGRRNVSINSGQKFAAASLYKLFLMAAVYKEVNAGKITLDTEISAKLSHLDSIFGGRDFGYEDFDDSEIIEYSVRESLERVAGISDNFAAIMLAEKISWGKVQAIAEELGAQSTTLKDPIRTSADDIGLVFEKLYKGEVVSVEASEQILDMLSKSKLNNRIPALLPDDLKIAHKTGELSRVRNDAGIVFLEGNPYVIVMMSKNLRGEDDGVENLAQISKMVFDYYAANPGEKR